MSGSNIDEVDVKSGLYHLEQFSLQQDNNMMVSTNVELADRTKTLISKGDDGGHMWK